MDEKVIYNYLQGETSLQEERMLFDWIKRSSENEACFYEMKVLWNTGYIMAISEEELQASLNLLNKKIDQKESSTKK